MKSRKSNIPIVIAYAGSLLLGLPNGALGVAWPAMRRSFGIPLDAVGMLLTGATIGYIVSSFTSGRVVSRVGQGTFLLLGTVVSGVGLLGYAVAPQWSVVVAFGLLVGIGAGAVDAGMNQYVAANHGVREMNWLHACFGIGVTLGPIVMTTLLGAGRSWRWAYGLVLLLQGLLAATIAFSLNHWPDSVSTPMDEEAGPSSEATRSIRTLRLPLARLGVAVFITHAGVQFTAGNWAYSLFTEARGVVPSTAGLWTSIYWGSLTVGRMILGAVAARIGVVLLLRVCICGIVLGSCLVWWNPADLASFLGLALIGFSLAPLFPSLTSLTPRRIGADHAANMIGFQVAAGSFGAALLPGLAGVVAENMGLEAIGPFLLVASLALLVLHEALVRRAP